MTQTNPPKATSARNEIAVDFQKRIEKRWNDAAESIVEVGKLLIEAKSKLGHGQWQKFTQGLPFSDRTAEMLMKIAENPILSNPKHVSNLPRSWGTLHRMISLPDPELAEMLANGTIKSDTTRPEIEEHIKKINGRYEVERIAKALHTLIQYMGKWRDLSQIPKNAFESLREGDHSIDLSDIPNLCDWLTKLHASL